MINREDLYGCAPDRGFRYQVRAIPFKVIRPPVVPRIEQRNDPVGFRISAGNIGTLAAVAITARQRQVVQIGLTAVLPGYDVVNMEGAPKYRCGHVAIFASVV